jgi:argininosuccinate synthase
MDANLLHISYEGGPLEDPWTEPPSEMWRWSVSPEQAPNEATYVDLTYAGATSSPSTASP